MKVLLAVDNAQLAHHLEAGLLKAGHCVEFAETGRQRIYLAAIETYDAIIWNRNLPGRIAGIGVVSTLRGSCNELPILLISELGSARERKSDLHAGGNDRDDQAQFAELLAWLDVLIGPPRGGNAPGAMQAQLEESEIMLAQVQRMSETQSWRWNVDTGEISLVNGMAKIFRPLAQGQKRHTINDLLDAIHPDDRRHVSAALSAAVEREENFDLRFRIVEDDAIKYLRAVGERRNRTKIGVVYLCSGMDVTGQAQREEALHRADAEIAHLSRVHTVGKFASSIVHEVNQPLSAIVTYSTAALHWLHRGEPDLEEASIALKRIIRDATRAKEVTARVRRLSKNGLPQKAQFSMGEVIEETLTLLARDLHTRLIAVESDIEHALPDVSGDRVQIQQVLINLILNAIEALEAVQSGSRVITVLAETVNLDQVRVVVRDNGPGVAADARERLFEPFFSTKDEGLGMGLSICRSIIQAHNGSLVLLNGEAPGAAFEFVLPASKAA
ncbi:Adaptive-response sensory-kinase SasA [Paraburkholderia hiiakae]|uniref:histidine kinase n=1 Tax=Paraburkholderia hiiakae TaxID=1081782 RepID=A0ABN7HS80_9BURK|nr:ATP-binding protein [Paraburkholderia hiiakae]CAD6534233.1 Adaptive-response sensory-kinase SasA [Paraburkholderia hiiakae]